MFEEPLRGGPNEGKRVERERYERMLRIYYEKRGWDENGVPKRETLEKFGLSDVADELYSLKRNNQK